MTDSRNLDRLVEDGQIVVKGNSHRALAAAAWLVTSLFPFASRAEENTGAQPQSLELSVQGQQPKQAAPDENTQNYNESQIRKVFSTDYAKKDAASKKALSEKLVQSAQDPKNDPKLAFSFYREAVRLAAESLDLPAAFSIAEKISESYNIRDLGMKCDAFNIARKLTTTPEQAASISESGLQLADAIFKVEDYSSAIKVANDARQIPKVSNEIKQRSNDLSNDIKQVQTAELALSADPNDAKSASVYARHVAFRRGKYEDAKEIAKKANDEDLKILINLEVMKPQTPDMQYATAQKYFESAKKLKGGEKALYEQRGIDWCNTALPNANALLKTQIEKQLKDFKLMKSPGLVDLLSLIDPKDAVNGSWKMQDGALVSDGSSWTRMAIPYEPPEEYDFKVKFARQQGTMDIVQLLSKGGKQFGWHMSAIDGTQYGFWNIGAGGDKNPSAAKRNVLENKRDYVSLVQVRKDGVKAYIDGMLVAQWKTDYSDMSGNGVWKLSDESILGVGSHLSPTIYRSLEIIEITGKGKRKK